MPLNPNIILGLTPSQVTDPLETRARYEAIQTAKQQQEMNALQLQQAKIAQAEAWDAKQRDDALREQFANNPNLGADQILGIVGPQRGLPIVKQMHDQRTAALTEQEKKLDLAAKQTARFASLAGSVTDDETYVSAIRQAVDEGLLPREKAVPLMIRKYGPEVQKYLDSIRSSALTAQQKFEEDRKAVQDQREAIKFDWERVAQPYKQQKTEADATAAQQEVAGTKPIQPFQQATIDHSKATAAETARHNKVAEGQGAARIGLERQRFDATIGSGMDANGQPVTPEADPTAKAIAEYKMAPPSPRSLSTPGGQALMRRVMALNPEYRADEFPMIQSTRKAFTSGRQGDSLNAINTALGHIGTMSEAYDAMKNGNIPLLNQIANQLGVQVGKDAVTTFRAVRSRVAPELVKAYSGTGGGQEERLQAMKDFSENASPDQSASALRVTAKLLDSKISAMEHQYKQGTGGRLTGFDFITPEAKATRQKLVGGVRGSAPSTAPAVGTVQGGYKFNGGDPADPKNWTKQ